MRNNTFTLGDVFLSSAIFFVLGILFSGCVIGATANEDWRKEAAAAGAGAYQLNKATGKIEWQWCTPQTTAWPGTITTDGTGLIIGGTSR